jgi:hypothetical protein
MKWALYSKDYKKQYKWADRYKLFAIQKKMVSFSLRPPSLKN